MILRGRGLNHEAGVSGGEGRTPSRKIPLERRLRSSVQVNSDCAVVKVRIKSVRQKEAWTHAAKAEGERELKRSGNRMDKSGRRKLRSGSRKRRGRTRFSNKAESEGAAAEAKRRNRKRRGSGRPFKQVGRERRSEEENRVGQARLIKLQFPVVMARGSHLFPYRTQKLSLSALMVLGWKRPGRVGRRRIPF